MPFLVALLALLIFLLPATHLTGEALAVTSPDGDAITSTNYKAPQQATYILLNILNGVGGCLITGRSLIDKTDCPAYDDQGQVKLFTYVPDGGALGSSYKLMAAIYTSPPTSTAEYLAYVGSNMGIVPAAYAQVPPGNGSKILSPVVKLWAFTRNVAYAAFILVIVAIGIMIMLRQKINPQTVISVQSALPGIVIGLILVTFSYLISALIVDLTFIAMNLVAQIFTGNAPGLDSTIKDPIAVATQSSFIDLFRIIVFNPSAFGSIVQPIVHHIFGGIRIDISSPYKIYGTIMDWVSGAAALRLAAGTSVAIIAAAIIMVALFIQTLRLFWELVKSYITILAVTIFAPLIILAASLPGRGGVLGGWLKTLLANVLVFPAVFAGILFAGMFLGSALDVSTRNTYADTLPFLGGLSPDLIPRIIGLGVLLALPGIPKIVKTALGVKDEGGFGAAAAAGFGLVAATGQSAGKTGWNTAMEQSGLAAARESYEKKRGQWRAATASPTAITMAHGEQVVDRAGGVRAPAGNWVGRRLGWLFKKV